MPNDVLIERILSLAGQATASERLVLKIAAALLKQIDSDYEIDQDEDIRIKLDYQEQEWLPGAFEVWNSVARPKDWAIPEHIEAARREKAAIQEIMDQNGLDYRDALLEYLRRRKKS